MRKDVYEVLERGGVWGSREIADELNIVANEVRKSVKMLRQMFHNNDTEINRYIFTTKGGYTIDNKPEHAMYEARLRMSMGTGVLINGIYVFKTSKKIGMKHFNQLKVEYKPKLLAIDKLL